MVIAGEPIVRAVRFLVRNKTNSITQQSDCFALRFRLLGKIAAIADTDCYGITKGNGSRKFYCQMVLGMNKSGGLVVEPDVCYLELAVEVKDDAAKMSPGFDVQLGKGLNESGRWSQGQFEPVGENVDTGIAACRGGRVGKIRILSSGEEQAGDEHAQGSIMDSEPMNAALPRYTKGDGHSLQAPYRPYLWRHLC